jgi:hypothetical protein
VRRPERWSPRALPRSFASRHRRCRDAHPGRPQQSSTIGVKNSSCAACRRESLARRSRGSPFAPAVTITWAFHVQRVRARHRSGRRRRDVARRDAEVGNRADTRLSPRCEDAIDSSDSNSRSSSRAARPRREAADDTIGADRIRAPFALLFPDARPGSVSGRSRAAYATAEGRRAISPKTSHSATVTGCCRSSLSTIRTNGHEHRCGGPAPAARFISLVNVMASVSRRVQDHLRKTIRGWCSCYASPLR